MIHVKRIGEPAILADKGAEWQAKYDEKRAASPALRPDHSKYAHRQVVEALRAMSHGKCFYCEADGKMTVDHHLEVAERGDLAFTWSNLYLACSSCQRKIPNKDIPAAECVDPCDEGTEPGDHLKFEAELITWRTPRGEQTIKKYRLKDLDSDRRRFLLRFHEELADIGRTKPWPEMSAEERERLLRYGREDHPYSMMFRAYLDRHGLR